MGTLLSTAGEAFLQWARQRPDINLSKVTTAPALTTTPDKLETPTKDTGGAGHHGRTESTPNKASAAAALAGITDVLTKLVQSDEGTLVESRKLLFKLIFTPPVGTAPGQVKVLRKMATLQGDAWDICAALVEAWKDTDAGGGVEKLIEEFEVMFP